MAAIEFFVPSNRRRANGMPQHMDGTNELVNSGRTNRNFAARRKRENTQWVATFAREAVLKNGWVTPKSKVDVTLTWCEVNTARDPDNIDGGVKYVMDALGTPSGWSASKHEYTRNPYGAGVIKDDSQKCVNSIRHVHFVDPKNPGVVVRVEVVDDD